MKSKTFLKALSLSLLLPALAAAEPVTYKVDTGHSGVRFTIRHFVSNVPGNFRDFDGVIEYDKQNPAASSVEPQGQGVVDQHREYRSRRAPARR